MIIECNEINPYYVYRHRRLDTFEIFYVGISKVKSRCRNRSTRNKIWKDIINKTKTTGLVMDIPYVCPE